MTSDYPGLIMMKIRVGLFLPSRISIRHLMDEWDVLDVRKRGRTAKAGSGAWM